MDVLLATYAEISAEKAEKLEAFVGVSLLSIKQNVANLLGLIGRDGIFDQYTVHNISHIDEMLKMLDWLIPENIKKNVMSPADWLLIVLAIYFHDLGMLVTKKEFAERNPTELYEFCKRELFAGSEGEDYRARVQQVYPDHEQAERFFYQEFVRYKHAERIRLWIDGKAPERIGSTYDAMREIQQLLKPLDRMFLADLGLVCESHHRDDLHNLNIYSISRPYGKSDEETANVQYAAALLRTSDILHITSDRTPSIVFRLISPSDPVSQQEWIKQSAVKRVRPKKGLNQDNIPDDNAPRDTLEVNAFFTDADGFFGLTSYLKYVKNQIRKTYDVLVLSNKQYGAKHEFPWRHIDENNIQTEGFIPQIFEFTFDQANILDLLTGHTLYNDTRVVIRELVQNSLDAIRLQKYQIQTSEDGKVKIAWNSRERLLSIEDNGTGMTQDIIERHLLKVGSSRYQDIEFKKQFPNFTSISRFGIGILSAFMIADEVEVITCHPDEPEARQVLLRSVHGKYLIRLLDKDIDESVKKLKPHGTLIRLRVRPRAKLVDVLAIARRWVVIPNCEVTVTIDDNPPVQIGFSSTRDAVKYILTELGLTEGSDHQTGDKAIIKVEQKDINGISLAYALQWSEYFREWNFVSSGSISRQKQFLLGTCIEGIRVDFVTPGFTNETILAIANITGPNAPKTNVARSSWETTPQVDTMLTHIYSIYCQHITSEIQALHNERSFSLTRAIQEAVYLLGPLVNISDPRRNLFDRSLKQIPTLLAEHKNQRKAITLEELQKETSFWTMDSPLFQSVEAILRQTSSNSSIMDLVNALKIKEYNIPEEPILCEFNNIFGRYVFDSREVDMIKIYKDHQRIDLRWTYATSNRRWRGVHEIKLAQEVQTILASRRLRSIRKTGFSRNILIASTDIDGIGLESNSGLITSRNIFLFSDSPLSHYLVSWIEIAQGSLDNIKYEVIQIFDIIFDIIRNKRKTAEEKIMNELKRYASNSSSLFKDVDLQAFIEAIINTADGCYDPYAWVRSYDEKENSQNDILDWMYE